MQTWLIPKTMFAQVYVEGKQYLLMDEIIDHRSNNLLLRVSDGFVTIKTATGSSTEIHMAGSSCLVCCGAMVLHIGSR
jgi:hypothetical protein